VVSPVKVARRSFPRDWTGVSRENPGEAGRATAAGHYPSPRRA